jgi:hypothetical protein
MFTRALFALTATPQPDEIRHDPFIGMSIV